MITHKKIDKICFAILVITICFTVAFTYVSSKGVIEGSSEIGYESRLFDTSRVHTIDIVIDDWEGFLETCLSETYAQCAVVIDNESYKNVAIRGKGNTSLTQVASYDSSRYSFKIDFTQYDSGKSYYGLDKLCLNNIIQDNTYMKDYLSYQMMGFFDVDAPLCSFVQITVNGEEWGLYLAVEDIDTSFLERNYGNDSGNLYKPDSQNMGGHNDKNGGGFPGGEMPSPPDGANMKFHGGMNQETTDGETQGMPNGEAMPIPNGNQNQMMQERPFMGDGMGSSDTKLVYTDDEFSSYSNIFDHAKTKITDKDKERLIASLKKLTAGEEIEDIVDVEEVIRYFVVHNFVCNFDSYTGSIIHNYYLYEKDGQMSMIPWDYNLAFGGFVGGTDATSLVNFPIDSPVYGSEDDSRPMIDFIFSNDEYTKQYHELFAEFINDYFTSGYFEEMVNSVKEMISPYVEADPTKFSTYEEFLTGIESLKTFCTLRAESVSGQLNGTIPATSEGQKSDTSFLIDASSIQISDMGGMQNGRGGMPNGNPGMPNGNNEMPNGNNEMPNGNFEFPNRPDNMQDRNQDAQPVMVQKLKGQDRLNPFFQQTVTSSLDSTTWILLGICVVVLVLGSIFAFCYGRRRWNKHS